jgi:hypothetical protein
MSENTIKPLVTAVAHSTGGRDGHAETTDRSVSVNLSVPRAMGGKGLPDTTVPEHLFACGAEKFSHRHGFSANIAIFKVDDNDTWPRKTLTSAASCCASPLPWHWFF